MKIRPSVCFILLGLLLVLLFAADLLLGDKRFAGKYSEQELQNFEKYIASRIEMVDLPDKDTAFLRERLLTMYANPVINKERALAEE